ncbi:MAG: hypothetical protein JSV19_02615 [Phycisphaerales bacterium]|nr:MAG: hypothetical protein JSV19_02615 [Phycisphaerales bacterium]
MKGAILHRLVGAASVVALISLALGAAQGQGPEHDETAITSVSDHRGIERVAPAPPAQPEATGEETPEEVTLPENPEQVEGATETSAPQPAEAEEPIVNTAPGLPDWTQTQVDALRDEISTLVRQQQELQRQLVGYEDVGWLQFADLLDGEDDPGATLRSELLRTEHVLGALIAKAIVRDIKFTDLVDLSDPSVVTEHTAQSLLSHLGVCEHLRHDDAVEHDYPYVPSEYGADVVAFAAAHDVVLPQLLSEAVFGPETSDVPEVEPEEEVVPEQVPTADPPDEPGRLEDLEFQPVVEEHESFTDVEPGSRVSEFDYRFAEGGLYHGLRPEDEILEQRADIHKYFRVDTAERWNERRTSPRAVHYQDESGAWQDILTAVVPNTQANGSRSEFAYMNQTNTYHSYFAASPGQAGYVMSFYGQDHGHWVSPALEVTDAVGGVVAELVAAPVEAVVSGDTVAYEGVYPQVTAQMTVASERVEQRYTIDAAADWLREAPAGASVAFSESIILPDDWVVYNGLEPATEDFESDWFSLIHAGEMVGVYMPPIVVHDATVPGVSEYDPGIFDQEGAVRGTYQVRFEMDGIRVVVQVSADWLKDPARRYPVTVEPMYHDVVAGEHELWEAITEAWAEAKTATLLLNGEPLPDETIAEYGMTGLDDEALATRLAEAKSRAVSLAEEAYQQQIHLCMGWNAFAYYGIDLPLHLRMALASPPTRTLAQGLRVPNCPGTCTQWDGSFTNGAGTWGALYSSDLGNGPCRLPYDYHYTSNNPYWYSTCDNGAAANFDNDFTMWIEGACTQQWYRDGGCASYRAWYGPWTCPSTGYFDLMIDSYYGYQGSSYTFSFTSMYQGMAGLWTGVTSTDWNTGSNWADGNVPDATVDVVIPSGCPNYPHLTNTLDVGGTGGSYNCASLEVRGYLYIDYNLSGVVDVYSTLWVNGGSLYVGRATLDYYSDIDVESGGTLDVDSGSVYICDELDLASGGTVDISAGYVYVGTYTGTVGVADGGSSADKVEFPAGSTFTMSGGALWIQKCYSSSYRALDIDPAAAVNVTGGEIRFRNARTDDWYTMYADFGGQVFYFVNVYMTSSAFYTHLTDNGLTAYRVYVNEGHFDANGQAVTIANSIFVYSGGTFHADAGPILVGGSLGINDSGVYYNENALTDVAGDLDIYGVLDVGSGVVRRGYYGAAYDSRIRIYGTGTVYVPGNGQLRDYNGEVIIDPGGVVNMDSTTATLLVDEDLTIDGTLDCTGYAPQIYVGEDFNLSGTFNAGSSYVYFDGSLPSYIYGSPTFYRLDPDKTGGAYIYLGADTGAQWAWGHGGNLDVNGHTLTTQYMDVETSNFIIDSGSCIVTGNGPYFHSGGILTMGSGGVLDSAGNIQFQSGASEAITGGTIYLEDNFTATAGNFTPTGGTVYCDGASTSYIYGSPTFYRLDCNKTVGAYTYLSADAGVSHVTYVHGGNLDVNGYTLTTQYMDVYNSNFIIDPGSCIVTGNGPYFHGGGILTMGSGGVLDSASNIQFQSGASEAITGGNIYLEGNLTATAGNFTPTGGTVWFDGGSSSFIYGSPSFYNLRIDKSAAASTYLANDTSAYVVNIHAGTLDIGGYTATVTGPASAGTAITLGDGVNTDDAYLEVGSTSVVDVTAAVFDIKALHILSDGQFNLSGTGAFNRSIVASDDYYQCLHVENGGVYNQTGGTFLIDNGTPGWWYGIMIEVGGEFNMSGGEFYNDNTTLCQGTMDFDGGTYYIASSAAETSTEFIVYSGGRIEARNTEFTRYGTDASAGVFVDSGAYVGTAAGDDNDDFDGCTFSNGGSGCLLRIANDETFNATGTTWILGSAPYNVSKPNNAGEVSLCDAAGPGAGEAYEDDPNGRVHWAVANDACLGATALTLGVPVVGETSGECVNAETAPYCGVGDGTGGALWYSIIGNDHLYRAGTCNSADFDTRIRVYTNGCGALTCVGGNDNYPGCAGNTSQVEWCSEIGREYLILVHGTGAAEGTFTLTVTDEGTSCDDGLFCNGTDTCSGGTCVHSGDPCLGGPECNDTCNEAGNNCYNPAGSGCGDPGTTDCDNPDTCDGFGTCVDNYKPPGTPCTDDGNDCTDDECDGFGLCIHPYEPNGTPCGDPGDTDCDNPDYCWYGACYENYEPAGTLCTDDGNDCTDDECDGFGVCIHPDSPAGTPCGDPTDTDCDNPDTCDGAGMCLDNYEPPGTLCTDDGMFCNGDEYCFDGFCSEHSGFPCAGGEWCHEGSGTCITHGDGDFEPDGDVDLGDFAEFQVCFTQSAWPACLPANMTGQDETIDLDDFFIFASVMSGP